MSQTCLSSGNTYFHCKYTHWYRWL